MKHRLKSWLVRKLTRLLTKEREAAGIPLCDFERLCMEIRPGDVVLVEGRSQVSNVIKGITQSPWTHAAIYIGRRREIDDPKIRKHIKKFHQGDPHEQLILEALLGEGTIISPLSKYWKDHLRICRPEGLSRSDARGVIGYCVRHLGCHYDVRHLLDLARFMFPWGILPRRWRSSLFEHNAGQSTRTVCSSLIAAGFASVHFPILPVMRRTENGEMRLYKRNFRLYTPRDFDFSPYFDIIKYPFLGFEDMEIYRQLPWDQNGLICNDEDDFILPTELIHPGLETDQPDVDDSVNEHDEEVPLLHATGTKTQ